MATGLICVKNFGASPTLFPEQKAGPQRSPNGEKKIVHAKLASVSNPIIVKRPDLVDQMNHGFADRYYLEDGGYELAENEVEVDMFCGTGGPSEVLMKAIGEGATFAVKEHKRAR